MAVHLDALPGILLSPTKTLEKLKKDANLGDGLKVYLMVGVIAFIVSLGISKMVMSQVASSVGSLSSAPLATKLMAGSDLMIVAGEILNFAVGLIIFLAVCWFIAKLTSALSGKKSDFNKTAGLLAYVGGAFTLFISLPLALILMLIGIPMPTGTGQMPILGNILGLAVFGLVALLVAIWEWMIAGKAAAIAIGATWGSGIASVLLAVLILGAIVVAIILIIAMLAVALFAGALF